MITELKILQTECALIGSLKLYKPCRGSYPSALLEKPPVWKVVGQIKDENLGYSDKPDLIYHCQGYYLSYKSRALILCCLPASGQW